jgi:radical SAM superfamily enzyme YgiQ (UPF0313 family)
MRIVFVTPAPALRRLPIYRHGGKFYGQPNSITGPLILGGILKKAGHQVAVYEELNGPVDPHALLHADVLCLSIMTSCAPRGYQLADLYHRLRKGRGRVIIGGMHASVMPREALAHADQVVTGECENIICDVVEGRLTDPIVHGSPAEDLDALPFPDYSILKTPCKSANIMSTRGCPFKCTFCSTSRQFAPYRQRSVENVLEEVRMYHDMGFKYMNFEDDNFTADKERAKAICRAIIAENLQFKETFFFGRTDMARDEELLDLLKQAHLTRVLIGIETLNPRTLDAIHKHQSPDDIKAAAAACRRHGIRLIASIVLGLDEDGPNDIRRAVNFAKAIDAYQLQPAILTPFPQTPIGTRYEEEERLLGVEGWPDDWSRYDLMNVTFMPRQMSPWELQDAFYSALESFYDVPSALRIGKLFGFEYGLRRLGLAAGVRLGSAAARGCADHIPSSYSYYLKHQAYSTGVHFTESGIRAPLRLAEKHHAPGHIPGIIPLHLTFNAKKPA